MREQIMEAMTQALVDELGLSKTIQILSKAQQKDSDQNPCTQSPDFIGMESYAKTYSEKKQEGRN